MGRAKVEHFDCASLVAQVCEAQPIGLRISTNHPEGFRRVLYLHLRRNPGHKLHILQCPESASAFLLVRSDFKLKEQQP
jgi:hypothetical protein